MTGQGMEIHLFQNQGVISKREGKVHQLDMVIKSTLHKILLDYLGLAAIKFQVYGINTLDNS
jgi:hypothetical protein